jgi:DNA repair exonuclease SbcCD ATPase subunit
MRLRPKKLYVRNFCQHRERELEIPIGTIGIIGPNGAGKSNLTKAMYVGLTGEPQTGTRSSLLNWESNFAYVEEWFDSSVGEIYVKRDIAKGTHLLRMAGKDDLTKKETVNKFLSDLVGLEVTRLDKISFIPQGLLTQFLRMPHGDRAKLFYSLFGLEQSERLSAAILQKRLKIAVPMDNSTRITSISKELEGLEANKKTSERELHDLKGLLMAQSDMYKLAQADSMKQVDTDIGTRLQTLNTELMELLGKMEVMSKGAQEDLMPITMDQVEQMWKDSQIKQAQEKIISDCTAALSLLETREKGLVKPESSVTKEQVNTAWRKAEDMRKSLKVRYAGKCDTCGAEYPTSQDELNRLSKELVDIDDAYETLERLSEMDQGAYTNYVNARTSIRSERGVYESMKAKADEALARIKDTPVISEEDYKAFKTIMEARSRREIELVSLKSRMQGLEIAIQACSTASVVPKDIKEKATQVVEAYEGLRAQLEAFGRVWAEADTKYRLMKETLDRLTEEQTRYSTTSGTITILDKAREILHPDCLPRRTAQRLIAEFNTKMIEYEAVFGYRFTCRLNQDLDFEVAFPEKTGLPVSVLSGGQEMAASVAALMTLHGMLASDFGLLVLDEPTYGLDPDALQSLVQVLTKACNHLQTKGMTIMVPSHEVALQPVFSSIIQL